METPAAKRRKTTGIVYPDIEPSDQDRLPHQDANDSFLIRQVQAFAAGDIRKGDTLRAKAITEVDSTNERLVRSCHPSLSNKPTVWVSESIFGQPIWLVDKPLRKSDSVFAGGRPIHYYPSDRFDYVPWGILTPRTPHDFNNHFDRFINPRRFLRATDLDSLRELFPKATGVNVFVAGFMVIIFDDQTDVQDAYQKIWPLELAGLRVFFDIGHYELTTSTLQYGLGLSTMPSQEMDTLAAHQQNTSSRAGSLGLKVQMQDGLIAMTTVTHGFVRLPGVSILNSVKNVVSAMLKKMKQSLSRYTPARTPAPTSLVIPAGVQHADLTSDPVGRGVWIVESRELIGTITRTYDRPSGTKPYPAGYKHDLSLITAPTLPDLTSPPGYPPVTGWGKYSTALDGIEDVFCVCQRKAEGPWQAITGQTDPTLFKRATVLGSGWRWDLHENYQTAFLLWHTAGEFSPADGWSGSPLCLGSPSSRTAKAVVFQNFQTHCRLREDPSGGTQQTQETLMKGGFILPAEIRNSTILTVPRSDYTNPFSTLPARKRASDEIAPERRSFSGI
ncbi:hypothetical protein N7456_007184 [Penicillium angulare]|uniref:Uncharacterized protein n=1 Tax=Penicillium angulare TaxID=116970 RepID=A0A9W9KDL6_9EURO|nr:hypothetical protein N7456_007184 [Penicillium angulare]